MDEKLLYKIHITGRVQGVGYRWSAVNEAEKLGIKGFVKNQYDGSVYIEAEGNKEQLDTYVEWCREGPRTGHVKSVSVISCPPVNYDEFRVEF
jgi:acylphosphatase